MHVQALMHRPINSGPFVTETERNTRSIIDTGKEVTKLLPSLADMRCLLCIYIPLNFYCLRKASELHCQNQFEAEPWRQQTGIVLGLRETEGRLSWGRYGIRPQQLGSVKSGTGCTCKENSIINSNLWQDVVFDPFCDGLWRTPWKSPLGNTKSFPKTQEIYCRRIKGGSWRRQKSSFPLHSHVLQQVL